MAWAWVLAGAGDSLGLPPWAQGSIALVFLAVVLSGKVVVLRGPYDRETARSDRLESLLLDKVGPAMEANTEALNSAMSALRAQDKELATERARREAVEQLLARRPT